MNTTQQGKDTNSLKKHTFMGVLPPYNWDFLNKFNIKNPPKIQLYRDFETNARYLDFAQSLIKDTISINNHLKEKIFGGIHCFKEYRFLENEYPYNIEKNINHYNLWFNPNIIHNTSNKRILVLLKFIQKNNSFIVFKNLPQNMSVPGILHYHVFFKG
jgi:hypothetical protein